MSYYRITWCDAQGNAACLGYDEPMMQADSEDEAIAAATAFGAEAGIDTERYHVEADMLDETEYDVEGEAFTVVDDTVEDVKPSDCGMADESWFIALCTDGQWVAWSDAGGSPQYFSTREEAVADWAEAADACRSMQDDEDEDEDEDGVCPEEEAHN